MQKPYLFLFVLPLLFIHFQCSSPVITEEPFAFPEAWNVMQQETFGDYEYQLGYTVSNEGFEEYQYYILHQGKPVVQQSCSNVTSLISVDGQGFLDLQNNKKPDLLDLNGDGSLELVIQDFTGGAHCCFQYWVYSLGVTVMGFMKSPGSTQPLPIGRLILHPRLFHK
jgi:hypothetical protein